MRNLRFWQKTYLLTLVLFLAALCGGVFLLGWQNQRQAMDSEVERGRTEQSFIAQSLARDMAAIQYNINMRVPALVHSYGQYYQQTEILLEVQNNEDILFSNLSELERKSPELHPQSGEQSWLIRNEDGETFLYVASMLPQPYEGYTVTCAYSLAPVVEMWTQTRRLLTTGCVAVAATLAVALFFVLRRLSKPLENLAAVADTFAEGNLSARARQKSRDEIGILADSFNHMADTAENNIVEIRLVADKNERMAANLSHEIRSPLTAIQGYAEFMLLAELSPEEKSKALCYIVTESARLQKISEHMLQLYTVKREDLETAPVKIRELIQRVLLSVRQGAGKYNVTLHTGSLPDGVIAGDEIMLQSLFTNLVDNAIKACGPGGEVCLSAGIAAGNPWVSIEDNGRGMHPGELEKLGEPFYRADKARSRELGGAGLGVALCYEIAHLHGAKLTYSSTPGAGTTATVEFTAS